MQAGMCQRGLLLLSVLPATRPVPAGPSRATIDPYQAQTGHGWPRLNISRCLGPLSTVLLGEAARPLALDLLMAHARGPMSTSTCTHIHVLAPRNMPAGNTLRGQAARLTLGWWYRCWPSSQCEDGLAKFTVGRWPSPRPAWPSSQCELGQLSRAQLFEHGRMQTWATAYLCTFMYLQRDDVAVR